jgi:hypothetical protein
MAHHAGLGVAAGESLKGGALVWGQRLAECREQEDAVRSPRVTGEHMTEKIAVS